MNKFKQNVAVNLNIQSVLTSSSATERIKMRGTSIEISKPNLKLNNFENTRFSVKNS